MVCFVGMVYWMFGLRGLFGGEILEWYSIFESFGFLYCFVLLGFDINQYSVVCFFIFDINNLFSVICCFEQVCQNVKSNCVVILWEVWEVINSVWGDIWEILQDIVFGVVLFVLLDLVI